MKVAHYQQLYLMVDKGYTKQDVIKLFGEPEYALGTVDFWDTDRLTDAEAKRQTECIRYCVRVPAYYIPVCFYFSFDQEGKIIGKQRLD